jgi:F420-dependent oxidoreductase-like protein
MIFGVFVPQGWKMELASIDGAAAKWAKTVEIATRAEQLGFDSIWVYDHFHNVPRPAHETVFECWTTVAALSQLTSTIRLGQMVGCASYRNPALLAKITSTVDVISGGRLDWGIGAGWYEHEYLAYGYDFPRAAERIAGLAETVEIVKRMWSEPDATFEGRYLSVAGAQCDPKPLQQPHPPIWIGGGGEQLTLRVVAEHADYSNFGSDLATWMHKRDVLRSHCDAVGRDAAEIGMTWSQEILLRSTEEEVAAAGNRRVWGGDTEEWRASNLVGTPEQVCEKLASYVGAGLAGIVTWCADYPDTETLELLARDVVPNFR